MAQQIDGFQPAFDTFLEGASKLYLDWARPTYPNATMTYEVGPRYIRVVKVDSQRSVYCFVDRTTGNILKAGSWKAPAKNGVRASIFDPDHGLSKMNWHGCGYLR